MKTRREVYSHITEKRYNQTISLGDESEARFESLMIERNNDVQRATPDQDKNLHIDIFVNGDGVDVKGNKKSYSLWLEVQNVFGNNGWLKGEAKWIAFDLIDKKEYQIYKREDLLRFVINNITETTDNNKDYLKYYTRDKFGGNDKIVHCKSEHIKHLLIQTISYATT